MKKIICNSITMFMIWAFLLSNSAQALNNTTNTGIPAGIKTPVTHTSVDDLLDFKIPDSWGIIKDAYNSGSEKLIINIQDAHCDFQAQQNISKILDRLAANYQLKLVTMEGASGKVSNPILEKIPYKKAKENTALYLVKEGKLTGAEYLAINSDYGLELYGVEDLSLYLNNLRAFEESQPFKAEAKQYFKALKDALDKLKISIYNADLRELDNLEYAHAEHKISFDKYAVDLFGLVKKHNLSKINYAKFYELQKVIEIEEKVDFQKADKERTELITNLTQTINDKENIGKLVEKSLSFKKGLINAADFTEFLKDTAFSFKLNLVAYPNFCLYADYIIKYEKVANEDLFKEIAKIKQDLKNILYTDEAQKQFDVLSRNLEILIKMVDLKMVNEDIEYFFAHKSEINSDSFIKFITPQAYRHNLTVNLPMELSYIDVYLPAWAKFYEIAGARDMAFIEKTLQEMDKQEVFYSALVTGGFHTEKLTSILKEKNISYLVIAPRASVNDQNPYMNIMQGGTTPVEKFLKQMQSTLGIFRGADDISRSQLSTDAQDSLESQAKTEQEEHVIVSAANIFEAIAADSPLSTDAEIEVQVKAVLIEIGADQEFVNSLTLTRAGDNVLVASSKGALAFDFKAEPGTPQVSLISEQDAVKLADAKTEQAKGVGPVSVRRGMFSLKTLPKATPDTLNNATAAIFSKEPSKQNVQKAVIADAINQEVSNGNVDVKEIKISVVAKLQDNPLFTGVDNDSLDSMIDDTFNALTNASENRSTASVVTSMDDQKLTGVVVQTTGVSSETAQGLITEIKKTVNDLSQAGKPVQSEEVTRSMQSKVKNKEIKLTGVQAEQENEIVTVAVNTVFTESAKIKASNKEISEGINNLNKIDLVQAFSLTNPEKVDVLISAVKSEVNNLAQDGKEIKAETVVANLQVKDLGVNITKADIAHAVNIVFAKAGEVQAGKAELNTEVKNMDRSAMSVKIQGAGIDEQKAQVLTTAINRVADNYSQTGTKITAEDIITAIQGSDLVQNGVITKEDVLIAVNIIFSDIAQANSGDNLTVVITNQNNTADFNQVVSGLGVENAGQIVTRTQIAVTQLADSGAKIDTDNVANQIQESSDITLDKEEIKKAVNAVFAKAGEINLANQDMGNKIINTDRKELAIAVASVNIENPEQAVDEVQTAVTNLSAQGEKITVENVSQEVKLHIGETLGTDEVDVRVNQAVNAVFAKSVEVNAGSKDISAGIEKADKTELADKVKESGVKNSQKIQLAAKKLSDQGVKVDVDSLTNTIIADPELSEGFNEAEVRRSVTAVFTKSLEIGTNNAQIKDKLSNTSGIALVNAVIGAGIDREQAVEITNSISNAVYNLYDQGKEVNAQSIVQEPELKRSAQSLNISADKLEAAVNATLVTASVSIVGDIGDTGGIVSQEQSKLMSTAISQADIKTIQAQHNIDEGQGFLLEGDQIDNQISSKAQELGLPTSKIGYIKVASGNYENGVNVQIQPSLRKEDAGQGKVAIFINPESLKSKTNGNRQQMAIAQADASTLTNSAELGGVVVGFQAKRVLNDIEAIATLEMEETGKDQAEPEKGGNFIVLPESLLFSTSFEKNKEGDNIVKINGVASKEMWQNVTKNNNVIIMKDNVGKNNEMLSENEIVQVLGIDYNNVTFVSALDIGAMQGKEPGAVGEVIPTNTYQFLVESGKNISNICFVLPENSQKMLNNANSLKNDDSVKATVHLTKYPEITEPGQFIDVNICFAEAVHTIIMGSKGKLLTQQQKDEYKSLVKSILGDRQLIIAIDNDFESFMTGQFDSTSKIRTTNLKEDLKVYIASATYA
ncbi:MAG: hypothetical protein ABIG64_04110 [Candidatus Omnitrophota bacterium]